jgi:hypothetical protein
MDLFDLVKSCVRRWYVVLPLLLLAAYFSHHIYTSVKPVYYSSAVIGVAPPNTRVDQAAAPGEGVPRNGLLDLGGASLITNMATLGLGDSSVRGQVAAAGGRPDYTVRMFPVPGTMPELPMIMIEATEPDPLAASKTVELVVAQADSTLRTLQQQANVAGNQMVTPFVVSPQSEPAPGMPSRTRSTIAVFVAGAGISILVTLLADVLLTRRTTSRRERRQTVAQVATDSANATDVASKVDPQNEPAAVDEAAAES